MLVLLHIENIAVIEEADIEFLPGFNALTGETGAGKSIVIDALGAVLGQRTSRDLIRTGADKAFVSAQFVGLDPELSVLKEQGIELEEGGSLLLQREICADGRNVCRVAGRPVGVAQLREIGGSLLNIHGQHDGQKLLDEEQHGVFLDRFGHTEALLAAFEACFDKVSALQREIRGLQMDEAEKARRVDSLKFQIDELERAQLSLGEEEELKSRRNILRNSEKFISAVEGADFYLNGGDSSLGAVAQIKEAEEALSGAKNFGDTFAELSKRLEAVRCEVYDLAETVRDMKYDFDFSPAELDAVEERLDLLYRLGKKYGATTEDMLSYLEKCRNELSAIEYADDTILQLEMKLSKAQAKAKAAAEELSKARKAAAAVLEKLILAELHELDMTKVRFSICIEEKEMDRSGTDQVSFLMSANVGEDLKPIHKIASGGELARIMLALKNVLSEQDEVTTMVFDEVDTGVSGRAAQKVAEKLAKISRKKQVLCVTHLPQIAAMADTHFSVEKGERSGRTYTQVVQMSHEERKKELARITGGAQITEAMLSGAEELLRQAAEYRASL
ncbi:MAG: DNA repair protein RecN [Oscillospiraceae bacterium]|nr:DNA repair protein RecN [Oscillospiraceae bacterium]